MRGIIAVLLLVAVSSGVGCWREPPPRPRLTLPAIARVRPAPPAPGDVDLRLEVTGEDVPTELTRLLARVPVRRGRIGVGRGALSWDGADGGGSSEAGLGGTYRKADGALECTFAIAGSGAFRKSWGSTAFMERVVVGVIHGTGEPGAISGDIEATDTIRADPGAGDNTSGVTRRAWRFTAESMAPDQSALP
jgi:hypothetical protein